MKEDGYYNISCLICGSKSELSMFAHRIEGKMVGWVFICKDHADDISGKDLNQILITLTP